MVDCEVLVCYRHIRGKFRVGKELNVICVRSPKLIACWILNERLNLRVFLGEGRKVNDVFNTLDFYGRSLKSTGLVYTDNKYTV